jgi:hypothetical protein
MPRRHARLPRDEHRPRARSRPRRRDDSASLAEDLDALRNLPLEALRERWRDLYGSPCPPHTSRHLLTRAVAYRIQEQALGGLDAATRRRLERAREALAEGRPPKAPGPKARPGTRLLREWQGVVHEVIVLERGVEYRGRTWRSLSAVAREITGAHWSGPRFFGLPGGISGQP